MKYELTVRVTVVGTASRRWRGAHSQAEADRLNRPCPKRAQNLRKPVEAILQKELPGVKIEVPAMGRGSSDRQAAPTREDNESSYRSVVVMVDLITAIRGTKTEFRPRKIYAPSKFWTLKVVSMIGASGGAKIVHMRVTVRGSTTGRELTLAGTLYGGALPNRKKPFDFGNNGKPGEPVGSEVTFTT
jgi:hypothetical protein